MFHFQVKRLNHDAFWSFRKAGESIWNKGCLGLTDTKYLISRKYKINDIHSLQIEELR